MQIRSALIGALVAAAAATGCSKPSGSPADAGTPTDGGGPGAPPVVQAVDRLGAYSAGNPRAMLSSATSPFILTGLVGTPIDPAWVGSIDGKNEQGFLIPSGLVVNDRRTGHTRVLTAADGVPTIEYVDEVRSYGRATAPIFDLTWLEKDKTFAAASWNYVVKGTLDAEGKVTFEKTTLRAPGATTDAFVSNVESSGDHLFIGTDQGLAVLNPADLSVIRWVNFGGQAAQIQTLSAANISGPVVVVSFGVGVQPPHSVAVVGADEADAHVIDLEPKEVANVVFGMQDAALVGVTTADLRGAIHAVRLTGDGYALMPAVSADELSTTSFGGVVPGKFDFDSGRNLLLVGGRIRKGNSGAGLIEVPMSVDGYALGTAQDVTDRRDPYHNLLPLQPELLHVDALGRWFVAGRSLCSESKYKSVGLYRIDQTGGELRLLRPWLSGVRTVSVDPDGQTWFGLRDDLPGVACDGAVSEQSVCRVRADGSCEIFTPYVNANLDVFSPSPGAARIAFGEPSKHEFALATHRDALFVRKGQTSRAVATQFTPGLNLEMTSAAWDGTGGLWIGSMTEWNELNDPNFDDDKINARSPHGLGWIAIGDDASPGAMRRYVRVASDNLPNNDIAGLPSNHVWDVLPLPGEKHALVALGIERDTKTYDHVMSAPNKRNISGGLALIEDEQITVIAGPAGTTFGDVVGLAKQQNGYLALDADAGVFTVDVQNKTSALWAAPAWTSPARATSIAVDADGRVAVGTTQGVYIYSAAKGAAKVLGAEVGVAWTVRFMTNGFLYAGTDQGVVRAALDNGNFETSPGPDQAMPRDLWELSWGCYGAEGCACIAEKPCALGLDCNCLNGLDSCTCVPPDPCVANPGSLDCACDDSSTCQSGLTCACALGGSCSCQPEPSCEDTCTCSGPDTTADGCYTGEICDNGSCVTPPPPTCTRDCSCTGADARPDGCPTDWECQNGIAGPSCAYVGPTSCADSCSCTGPNTTADGCPSGFECQQGFAGPSCVEVMQVTCDQNCTCTGPNTTDGCPDGTTCVTGPHSPGGTCR